MLQGGGGKPGVGSGDGSVVVLKMLVLLPRGGGRYVGHGIWGIMGSEVVTAIDLRTLGHRLWYLGEGAGFCGGSEGGLVERSIFG